MQFRKGKLYSIRYMPSDPTKAEEYIIPERMSSSGYIFYYHVNEPHIERMFHISSVTRGDFLVEEVNGD